MAGNGSVVVSPGGKIAAVLLTPSTPLPEGGYLVWYIAVTPANAAESLLSIEWPYQGGEAVMPI